MIVLAMVIACALVLAQGAAIWAFLRFVKSFGAFTESQGQMTSAMLAMHESNMLLHHTNLRLLDELRHHNVKGKRA